jgi:ABC-type antimicrobial peptide transport system permease subunit
MVKNYLKIALRRFWRHRTFTLINVLGLSAGLAIAMVMLVSMQYMHSYDKFHENTENIYQVGLKYNLDDSEIRSMSGPGIWGYDLQNNHPEVIMNSRLMQSGELLFNTFDKNGDVEKRYIENNGVGVDSTFFSMFSFPLEQGKPEDILVNPNSIVITKEFGNKYFGKENPIGKSISINGKYSFTVTGVLKDLPKNTVLGFDFYFNVSFFEELGFNINDTDGNVFNIYILTSEGADLEKIKTMFSDFVHEHYVLEVEYEPFFMIAADAFMYGDSMNSLFMNIFFAIAIFILIMACINFMNLSTASSLQRSKEIALRKIAGAKRSQLIKQILSESVLLSFISLNIGIVIAELIFDFFDRAYGQYIPFDLSSNLLWLQLIGLALFTGLMAGSYPAVFLSSFKPLKVLSFNFTKAGAGKVRKVLVVFQFLLAIVFLTFTITSFRLNQAVRTQKKGVKTDNVLSISINGEISKNYKLVKSELLRNPNISFVSSSSEEPTWVSSGEFEWGITTENNEIITRVLWADYDYFDLFDIKLKEGRYYSEDYSGDLENSIVVNQVIIDQLKLEDPIGSRFYLAGKPYTIIGVVEYFNFFPIELGGRTLVVKLYEPNEGKVYIRYRKGTYPLISESIQEIFEKYNPSYPYEYTFYSDYKSPVEEGIENLNKQLVFFTIIGLFISILGLLGLSAFMVEQKTKEIGIRKALGATVGKIVSIITKQFFKLILISNVIALPLSYLIYNYASSFFTIKTTGDIFVYPTVFLFIYLLAFIIIYSVTIKAARTNPAQSLRYE